MRNKEDEDDMRVIIENPSDVDPHPEAGSGAKAFVLVTLLLLVAGTGIGYYVKRRRDKGLSLNPLSNSRSMEF
jgi:hypothetical protein